MRRGETVKQRRSRKRRSATDHSKISGGDYETRLLFIIAGSIIGLALPVVAQEKKTVDPEVRQQIEAAHMKFDEAYNRSDAAGCTANYTQDTIEVWSWETAGGVAISQQAIEIRAAGRLALNPAKRVRKLVQVYPIGDEICAISEFDLCS